MSSKQSNRVPVLFCGNVDGRFKSLFKIVTKLNKDKGPFEALYCTGDFFHENSSEWQLVKSGEILAPIPCYILGPSKPEHVKYYSNTGGTELAHNIIHLGKKGILTTSGGLKIVYLSGVEGHKKSNHEFTAQDIIDLQNNFQGLCLRGADFLLTAQWPKNVSKCAVAPDTISSLDFGSDLVSFLAVTVKPCYHFSALEEVFYERTPYRNIKSFSNQASHSTRFISLAPVGNQKKMRFLYAISHVPISAASEDFLRTQAMNEVNTECPYKEAIQSDDISSRFAVVDMGRQNIQRSHRRNDERSQKRPSTAGMKCWFCLRFPVEKHLIISVGQHCYVSFAKGWLVPGHLLIISHSHHKSTAYLSNDALEELNTLKSTIRQYFLTKNKTVVFFERNYKSFHLQLQAVPLPTDLADRVEDSFLNTAGNIDISLDEVPPDSVMKQVVGPKKSFFCLEIDGLHGNRPKKFVSIIEKDFPLNFSREVLASRQLLNMPDKADWKNCSVPLTEETRLCNQFRKEFLHFQTSNN